MDIVGAVSGLMAGLDLKSLLTGAIMAGLVSMVAVYLIKNVLLSKSVFVYIGNHIDDWVDALEKKHKDIGTATRQQLIIGFKAAIHSLEEDDGVN